jgi:hypothetical protein
LLLSVSGSPWHLILGDLYRYCSSLLVTFQNSSTDNPFYSYVPYPSWTDEKNDCIFIVSYPILSYPIISYPIVSYHIIPYHILSYPIISSPILSHPIQSYHILSYDILSYPFLSYPVCVCSCSNNCLLRIVHWHCKDFL